MHLDSPPTRNDVAPDPCTREGPREPRMAVRRAVLRAEAPDVRGGKQPRPADAQDGVSQLYRRRDRRPARSSSGSAPAPRSVGGAHGIALVSL
jgi:hypothetical protein